jgi:hypothetical protein
LPPILLGTHIVGTGDTGDTGRREAAAQASLEALARSGEAACVNLAFADGPVSAGALPTLPVLTQDAPSVAGVEGRRKPITSELIDVLAAEAERRGMPRFGLVNGDIVILPEALARDRETCAPAAGFTRTDVGGGEPESGLVYGLDMFIFDVGFWKRERHRFRPYVFGDALWDNVYGAIVASHGGTLFTRERLILHERHGSAWHDSPFASYVHLLAARDASYFSAWCAFVDRAKALRAAGGTIEEERALQRRIFRPPGVAGDTLDAMRASWWRVKRAFGA